MLANSYAVLLWSSLSLFVQPVVMSVRSEVNSVRRILLLFMVLEWTAATADAQYTDLLSNRSLRHWMTPTGGRVESGWIFDPDGTLHLQGRGGNIVTRRQYENFELWFDFRISEKGNNGVKYRVRKYGDSLLGCEYQILDDNAFPTQDRNHLTASLYDVFDPRVNPTRQNPPNEFNVGRILVQGNRIRHWLNGQLTIDACAGTRHWNEAIANSKFSDRAGFGQNRCGRIMLTDHNSEVWFRNLFIRRR